MVKPQSGANNGRTTEEKRKPQSQSCQDFAAFCRWSECRDSNSRPLGPEIVLGETGGLATTEEGFRANNSILRYPQEFH